MIRLALRLLHAVVIGRPNMVLEDVEFYCNEGCCCRHR